MKLLIPALAALLLTACSSSQFITYQVPAQPEQSLQPAPQKVLLLNTFNPAVYRNNNKREMLTVLTDTLLAQMARQLSDLAGIETQTLFGHTPVYTTADAGSIIKLMETHGASHAISIKELDLFFDQTNVEVTKTQTGKEREAFYDICSNIQYELFDRTQRLESTPVQLRRFHSSRQVISGLLAAGPSYAKNKNDFYNLAADNKDRFLSRYFPVYIHRKRILFTGGPLKPVGKALSQNDYTQALQRSLQLTESASREVRAQAWYNSAVLSERLNRLADAERYLQRSLQLMPLAEALAMERDLYRRL